MKNKEQGMQTGNRKRSDRRKPSKSVTPGRSGRRDEDRGELVGLGGELLRELRSREPRTKLSRAAQDSKPVIRLAGFLCRDSQLVHEVGAAFGSARFFVVRPGAGGTPSELPGYVPSGPPALHGRQDLVDDRDRKRFEPPRDVFSLPKRFRLPVCIPCSLFNFCHAHKSRGRCARRQPFDAAGAICRFSLPPSRCLCSRGTPSCSLRRACRLCSCRSWRYRCRRRSCSTRWRLCTSRLSASRRRRSRR